ncbi:MAG TPA: site-2 protease family protein [Acidimicrobiales bacterium]|nr:site-2 protease family protein [Acidimicrobiales bacterium]
MSTTDATTSAKRSLVWLLASIVVVVALLTLWAGWALPVVIGAILLMVMGHEFGHFIVAKRAGMKVTDFFVGFGPVVWSITRGETRYGVRALWLGGYVKVPGMTWSDEIDPQLEGRTYRAATYPRKVLFASAGSLMHVVMALALAWASLALVGLPSSSHIGVASFTHWDGYQRNAAQVAGIHVGDRIVSVDGRRITSADTLVNLVHRNVGHRLTVVVERDGKDVTLHATPVDGRTLKVDGVPYVTGSAPQGFLGIALQAQVVKSSWFAAVPRSFTLVGSMLASSVHAIVHVFSPGEFSSLFHQVSTPGAAVSPSAQLNRPQSIVGVVRIAVQSTQAGVGVMLAILMMVNIFVGVFNMMPMLPLDGGYVAVATYERLRSRRGRRYHADVNRLVPLVYAFMTVLLVLFACTLYLDIVHPITNPFN